MAKKEKKHPDEMSFLDHLEELRWHLIRSTIAIVSIAIVAFIFKEFLFDVIIFGPSYPDFISYDVLCKVSQIFGLEKGCITEGDMEFVLQSRKVSGQFSVAIWTSITAGFVLGFPYLLYEFWRFISPGLYSNERKSSKGFIAIASFLFFLGVLFGYFVIVPLSINFLSNFSISKTVENQFDIESFISIVRSSVLAGGIIFELPIIIFFLSKIGLVTPAFMRKNRKFALVIVLIISAVITPPDIATQVIVSIPILVLYEVSIYISRLVEKREERRVKKAGLA
jgi:sec-independent protein translocase protein TatC